VKAHKRKRGKTTEDTGEDKERFITTKDTKSREEIRAC
jgi:hypothetical protein